MYQVPRDRLLAQIDADLKDLAAEVVRPGSVPEVSGTFEAAAALEIIAENYLRLWWWRGAEVNAH